KLDILCVPSMQSKPDMHHRTLANATRHNLDGFYVAYANAMWIPHANGRSSFLGHVHRNLKQELEHAGYPIGREHPEHFLQMPDPGRNLIVQLDLDVKRPFQTQTVHDLPPVRPVFADFARSPDGDDYLPVPRSNRKSRTRVVCFDADGTITAGVKFS